eukprot:c25038_g1_i3 orf=216-860(-)
MEDPEAHADLDSPSNNGHASPSQRAGRDFNIFTSAETCTSAMPLDLLDGKECSMCGDVGIYGDLFQCKRCNNRYQHLYCSRSYPNLGLEKWVCNWCLHADSSAHSPNQQKSEAKRKSLSTENNDLEFLLPIAESLPGAGLKDDDRVDCYIRSSKEINPAGGYMHVPKRARCAHVKDKNKVASIDKWRAVEKNALPLTPSKGIVRHYKLLADVLC